MNLLSVDVDDFVTSQAESFGIRPPKGYEPTVASLLPRCLDALSQRDITATFFFQGWIARRWPDLVRSTAAAGHEIASHGMTHHLVDRMPRSAFAASARDSRRLLQDISGQPVNGYRSACFSAIHLFDVAQQILLEAGYRYDSSAHFRRGQVTSPALATTPLLIRLPSGLREVPLSTVFFGPIGVSVGSSFYTRRLPPFVHRRLLNFAESRNGGVHVYFHPNELLAEKFPYGFLVRHPRLLLFIGGIRRGSMRIARLLDSRKFSSIEKALQMLFADA